MNLKTSLFKYQQQAVTKLLPLRVGALFMDMGTGKTRTALELIELRKRKIKNTVWFSPVSIKMSLAIDIQKHSSYQVYIFNDKTMPGKIPEADIYIIGIESMSSSARIIFSFLSLVSPESFIIVDESSYIKNPFAKRSAWIIELSKQSKYRLILTGTPVTQDIKDLYSQSLFLSPLILGYHSFYAFAQKHIEYTENKFGFMANTINTDFIIKKLEPYVFQVTKKECLDLPPQIYKDYYFPMTSRQAELYWQAKCELLLDLADEDIDSVTIYKLFSALLQIVSGFWNYDEFHEFRHERSSLLMTVLSEISSSEKVIIWCHYHYDIEHISKQILKFFKVQPHVFYGKQTEKQKYQELQEFQNQGRFLIMTTASGSHGLNITEASYNIFYNNTFKYSERQQAENRTHRIGQTRPVTYIDLVCQNSIDEKIQAAFRNKQNLIDYFRDRIQDKSWLKTI